MPKVCPDCGVLEGSESDGGKKVFVQSFCVDCYCKRNKLFSLPTKISFVKCPRCSRIRRARNEWKPVDENTFRKLILSKMKGKQKIVSLDVVLDEKNKKAFVKAVVEVEGHTVNVSETVPLRIEQVLCTDCSRSAGGYHEAIIQLRGNGNKQKVERLSQKLARLLSEKTFVVKREEKREGIDLLVGDKRVAIEIVSRLGLHYSLSNKLVGMKDGKNVHRTTICIRF